MNRNNLAYDLSKYENAIRKEDEPNTKINVVKVKSSAEGSAPKIFIITVTAGILLGMVIYGKVEEAALHTEITNQGKYVEVLRSENIRMKTELEGKTSIKAVEEYAENILGMKKLDKSQVEYLTIENGNIIDIPEANGNIFVKIKNSFIDFLEYIRG